MEYKVCVYPFCDDIGTMLQFSKLISDEYIIKALAAPKSWGFSSNSYSYNETKLEVIISLDEAVSDNDCDCILIPNCQPTSEFEAIMISNIKSVLKRIKKIICCAQLSDTAIASLRTFCKLCGCAFELKTAPRALEQYDSYRGKEPESNIVFVSDVPVIAIGGVLDDLDQLYCSLLLRENLQSLGYKVSQVGAQNYCELLGFHSFPDFMHNSAPYGPKEKIEMFETYTEAIIENEQPDVFIITLPESINSLSSKFRTGYGIIPYMVSQAIKIDFMLICTFYETSGIEFYDLFSELCKYKLNCPVDCFHMANRFVDFLQLAEGDSVELNYVEKNEVNNVIDTLLMDNVKIPIYNLFEQSSQEKLISQIINKLTNDNAF